MAGVAASDSVEIGFDTQISASNQTLTLHPRNTGKTPGDALSSDVGGGMTTAPPQSESELSHASGECGADELCRFPVMDFSDSPSVCRPHPTSIR
jgi:hypothetical protein